MTASTRLIPFVALLALLVAGSPLGVAQDEPECPSEDQAPTGTPEDGFLLRLEVENSGGPRNGRICFFGPGGAILYARSHDIPAGILRSWDLRLSAVPDSVLVEHPRDDNAAMGALATWFEDCGSGRAAFHYQYTQVIYVLETQDECLQRDRVILGHEDRPAELIETPLGPTSSPDRTWIWWSLGVASFGGLLVLPRSRWFLLGLFSRITGPRALDHGTRSRVVSALEANPALRANELAELIEVPKSTLAFHLATLRRERLVASIGNPFASHYFVAGRFPPQRMRQLVVLRNPDVARFFDEVRARPGRLLTEVASALGLSRPRASKYAQRLEAAGAVRRQRDGGTVRLYPA